LGLPPLVPAWSPPFLQHHNSKVLALFATRLDRSGVTLMTFSMFLSNSTYEAW
jgi:hypothetical protein